MRPGRSAGALRSGFRAKGQQSQPAQTHAILAKLAHGAIMPDRIFIAGLEVYCIIGLQAWERQVKQKLHIDLTLETDTREAAASDTVADALDYRAVSKRVLELVEGSAFQLVETLAERVAATVLAEFPRARALTVRVAKPGAVRFSESVGVEIHRTREGVAH